MIDTHVHMDASEFAGQGIEIANQARLLGVKGLVIPAVAPSNFNAVRQLAEKIPGAGYCLGIHPLYVQQCADADLEALSILAHQLRIDPRFLAIGEIGLDHFVPGLDRERQLRFFQFQLALARELALPVVMHVRKSVDIIGAQCRRFGIRHGIAHAFNGSFQQAQALIDQGLCLGFGGAMTFTRALQLRRMAKELPLDSIVLETDAPDIAPAWLQQEAHGQANSPLQLPRIAQTLADLRSVSFDQVTLCTTTNALRCLPNLLGLMH